MLILGSVYTFGALTPYIASYLFYHNRETTNTALSLIFTLALTFQNFGLTFSTIFLPKYLSYRVICLTSIFGMSTFVFISSFQK
jgi:hypothetical protein